MYGLIVPLVPFYTTKLGVGPGKLGSIFAVYSLALLLVSLQAGAACDRIGRRPVLIAGLLLLMVSTLLFAWSGSIWWLMVSRFFQGASGAAVWTAGLAAAAAIIPPQERGKKLGIMMALTGLGTIAGPIYSGFLFAKWGYQAPFLGIILLILPITLSLFFLPLPTEEKEDCSLPRSSFIHILTDSKVTLVVLLVSVVSFGLGMLEPILPLHLARKFNMDSRDIGLFFGCFSLAFSVIQPVWGYVSDRIGYRPLILTGLVSAAIMIPVLPLVNGLLLLYILGCLFSISINAIITPSLPLLAQYSEQKGRGNYGRNFGLVNAAYSVGLLLGPVGGGIIVQNFSFLHAAVMYSLILLALGAVISKVQMRI